MAVYMVRVPGVAIIPHDTGIETDCYYDSKSISRAKREAQIAIQEYQAADVYRLSESDAARIRSGSSGWSLGTVVATYRRSKQ